MPIYLSSKEKATLSFTDLLIQPYREVKHNLLQVFRTKPYVAKTSGVAKKSFSNCLQSARKSVCHFAAALLLVIPFINMITFLALRKFQPVPKPLPSILRPSPTSQPLRLGVPIANNSPVEVQNPVLPTSLHMEEVTTPPVVAPLEKPVKSSPKKSHPELRFDVYVIGANYSVLIPTLDKTPGCNVGVFYRDNIKKILIRQNHPKSVWMAILNMLWGDANLNREISMPRLSIPDFMQNLDKTVIEKYKQRQEMTARLKELFHSLNTIIKNESIIDIDTLSQWLKECHFEPPKAHSLTSQDICTELRQWLELGSVVAYIQKEDHRLSPVIIDRFCDQSAEMTNGSRKINLQNTFVVRDPEDGCAHYYQPQILEKVLQKEIILLSGFEGKSFDVPAKTKVEEVPQGEFTTPREQTIPPKESVKEEPIKVAPPSPSKAKGRRKLTPTKISTPPIQ